jgi:hypothetical protein
LKTSEEIKNLIEEVDEILSVLDPMILKGDMKAGLEARKAELWEKLKGDKKT